jgi:hypothetical protein
MRLSQEPCLEVKVNSNRLGGPTGEPSSGFFRYVRRVQRSCSCGAFRSGQSPLSSSAGAVPARCNLPPVGRTACAREAFRSAIGPEAWIVGDR